MAGGLSVGAMLCEIEIEVVVVVSSVSTFPLLVFDSDTFVVDFDVSPPG